MDLLNIPSAKVSWEFLTARTRMREKGESKGRSFLFGFAKFPFLPPLYSGTWKPSMILGKR
jgi:hypothetical protein